MLTDDDKPYCQMRRGLTAAAPDLRSEMRRVPGRYVHTRSGERSADTIPLNVWLFEGRPNVSQVSN